MIDKKISELSNKELIQAVGINIDHMGWSNLRELKEIVDDEYNKREAEFYESNYIKQ